MTQRIEALAALLEDQSPVLYSGLSTHVRWFTTTCNSSPPPLVSEGTYIHRQTDRNK